MSGRHSHRDEYKGHKWKCLGKEAMRNVYQKLQSGKKKDALDWKPGEKTTETWIRGGRSVSWQNFQHHNREGENVRLAEQRACRGSLAFPLKQAASSLRKIIQHGPGEAVFNFFHCSESSMPVPSDTKSHGVFVHKGVSLSLFLQATLLSGVSARPVVIALTAHLDTIISCCLHCLLKSLDFLNACFYHYAAKHRFDDPSALKSRLQALQIAFLCVRCWLCIAPFL